MKPQLESLRATIIDRLHDAEYGSFEWYRWIVELRNASYLLWSEP